MKWLIVVLFLAGCSNEPYREYAGDLNDNPQCLMRYGAMRGCCGQ